MIYYLKLNRCINYSLRNLQVWIDAIADDEDAYVYILCDNEPLNERIRCEIKFGNCKYEFLRSIKREEDRNLMELMAVPRWYNAGYAHLTPFLHARACGYVRYWNIDADDTMFGLRPKRILQALKEVESYAIKQRIDLFSLDMWRSRSRSMHWSFGITFTNGEVDWMGVMKKYSQYKGGSQYFSNWNHPKNIDEFFTYVKAMDTELRIETFYFENLLFLHYSDDFIMNPITSGVFRWKGNKLVFPIIRDVYGIESLGNLDIAGDAVKLDIGIDDYEGGFALACNAPFSTESVNIVEAKEFETLRTQMIQHQIESKVKHLPKSTIECEHYYIFGFGNFTGFLITVLRENHIEPVSILDNAQIKWGGPIDGLMVTTPKVLEKEDMDRVHILIDVRFYESIFNQLIEMGIPKKNIIKIVDYTYLE